MSWWWQDWWSEAARPWWQTNWWQAEEQLAAHAAAWTWSEEDAMRSHNPRSQPAKAEQWTWEDPTTDAAPLQPRPWQDPHWHDAQQGRIIHPDAMALDGPEPQRYLASVAAHEPPELAMTPLHLLTILGSTYGCIRHKSRSVTPHQTCFRHFGMCMLRLSS